MRSIVWIAASVGFSQSAQAVDGLIEINQACVNTTGVCGTDPGCFPGDTACFPVTITQPGSYVLTSSLTLPNTNTGGIEVQADVVIDLNGFGINGPGTCTGCPVTSCTGGTGRGIYNTSGTPIVAVRNGGIQGMGAAGIDVTGGVGTDQVYVARNGGAGINVIGGGRFLETAAVSNGGDGLSVNAVNPAVVRDATATCNGGEGIQGGVGSRISDGNVLANGGAGIYVDTGSLVTGISALNNDGYGIECGPSGAGYGGNVLTINLGGGNQVSPTCAQVGTNLCDGTTTCP